ncbi:ImmA/IrrE family metallo-endopeptidase [Citreicoccus inhibens]|uniref:ImmA/IrrE family metallo-endopeptidase n=1 Tax=Citreicoccus inhibens TaxID=2849499 RepID=UPI001C24846E|nr:ImmA/IrrE family metallo-endopeptidase [Citreicoccus inhibens]
MAFIRGALVRNFPLVGCEGRLTHRGERAVISVSTLIDYAPRRRFVIAHELGHLELHRDVSQLELSLCSEREIDELYDQGLEKEANAFASELLMPTEVWRKRCDVAAPSLEVVSCLAQEFDVSFTAAAVRFAKLAPERCCVVFSHGGKVQWAVAGQEFGHWVERGQRLHPATLAINYFKGARVPDEPQEVRADAWLESARARGEELWEHSRPMPSRQAVLTLLWIPYGAEY